MHFLNNLALAGKLTAWLHDFRFKVLAVGGGGGELRTHEKDAAERHPERYSER